MLDEVCTGRECFNDSGAWTMGDLFDFAIAAFLFYIVFVFIADKFWSRKEKKLNKKSNNKNLKKSENINSFTNSSESIIGRNSEINNLKEKLEQLNEEDELELMREELNKKRLERALISLSEYEQLEQDIKNTREIYKAYKTDYFEIIDEKKSAKSEKYFGTLVLSPLSLFMLYTGLNSNVWFLTVLGILSALILIYNFSSKSKFIKWSDSEIERLTIEKDSSLKELNKLKKKYKNQTI
tara:strand:- start:450 stop:1166 length:717 start_codon:yes stop_codon:yes gene_type:complete